MFTTSYDQSVKIFGTKCLLRGSNPADDWLPIRTMQGHENKVTSVAVSRTLKFFVTTGFDKCFKKWEATY